MTITPLEIPEVLLIQPRRFGDDRGWFEETWNRKTLAAEGVDMEFVQDNQSLSRSVGTIRGLHFQAPPFAQAKLVRVAQGRIHDFAVDIRRSSPTYGKWVGAELSAENGTQLLVPQGFAHAFVTREPDTVVCYKVDGFYDKASEGGIRFDDPDLAIDWGVPQSDVILSDKDLTLGRLADLPAIFD
ncbi:dTDP-4-dehydrorhamnose 3,5-epimerase [Acuticoccus sp. MNP-M23]|uniref:dTDP-4-dehydrorhamnose 3,5-epimerase n=1 Tax=Acuticoccus sp. MNP-M23 TaxID=3072793 RepID=UPI0028167249|nr:dTDP-4-dehydrorhamnose 3,5-epimerase [Acuticoccus sp. MNP-M23]WMS40975.1 dTDP-4-dehydrorhamnose 3,5-epimerase [Acuticoccus sp. MNP-M23]